MKEVWRNVIGFEGLYLVSNLGRIKSLEKEVWNGHQNITKKEQILKYGYNEKGYYLVKLYKNQKSYSKKVHRLVGEAFIPNPDNLPQINHKDGNKHNNDVSNLEWCTNKENVRHAWNNRLCIREKGSNSPYSKKVMQFNVNNKLIKIWGSVSEAQDNLHIKNISTVCHGKRKTAGGYVWRYEND